jgi:parallel beta-helix repeat protein
MTGTIYIMADGRIEPSDAPVRRAGNIYTLTDNIASEADGIVVKRNNIVIDGAGYTIRGTGDPSYTGICLELRTNVIIKNVKVKNFGCGIWLNHSSNCIIRGNSIENNKGGILISDSSNNSIVGNNIKENKEYGILLEYSSKGNVIHHNNFINNGKQVYLEEESLGVYNVWDNGYPSGGNYWSDYRGVDEKSGPNQEQPGSDGIGDAPYIIDEKNRDRYPLITPTPTSQ